MDPERAHGLAARAAGVGQRFAPAVVKGLFGYEHEALEQTLWGHRFLNPVGLAAGFDKNARLVPFWAHLGFGFAEVGSVTAQASQGNQRPRLFRLPVDRALINRMGLNNEGAASVAARLRAMQSPRPLGINLAKTHDPGIVGREAVDDFLTSFRLLAASATYVALNVSCPNTREGKTFEQPDALDELLGAVLALRSDMGLRVPVLVKLSPPMTEAPEMESMVTESVAVALRHGIDGFIATNTASDRAGLRTSSSDLERMGAGGLSGAPLERRALALVRYLYRASAGRVPIIGVGAISDAETAWARITAGASLVELYTAMIYEGPGIVKAIKRGLVARLRTHGLSTIGAAVGLANDQKIPHS